MTTADPLARPTATPSGGLLARALTFDALASGGMGVALAALSGLVDDLLGIPTGWLLGLGVLLVAYGVDVGVVAARLPRTLPFARAVVVANTAWVVGSVLLVALGGFALTAAGVALVLAQAAVVAALTTAQVRGLRG